MKNIVYVGVFNAVVTADGTEFLAGESVSVSDELAASLLQRDDFTEPKTPKAPTPKPEEGSN